MHESVSFLRLNHQNKYLKLLFEKSFNYELIMTFFFIKSSIFLVQTTYMTDNKVFATLSALTFFLINQMKTGCGLGLLKQEEDCFFRTKSLTK